MLTQTRKDPRTGTERREYKRQWYLNNLERERQRHRDRYRKDRERILEYQRLYRLNNPEKRAEARKKWERNHKTDITITKRARRAKIKGIKIVKEDIYNWESRVCGICDEIIEGGFHIDHIIPLARGGPHSVENLQLAHPRCNQLKADKLPEDTPPVKPLDITL